MLPIEVAVQLEIITQQINRYAPIFLLLFGVFGNLLNCLVFTQRTLRTNPCCVYFFAASLMNLILFVAAFTPRIMDGWKPEFDLTETVSVLCQLLLFVIFSTRTIVVWMIALATVDRYLVSSSNTHRRQMSDLKNTYRCILFTCIISFIVWIELFFCFDANLIGTPLKCYAKSDICRRYNDLGNVLITIIIPIAVMIVFGFGAIRNIHQRRKVAPNNIIGHRISRNRRSERSLIMMLFTQVLILVLLNLPFAIITFYLSYTFYLEKVPVQRAIENFLYNISLLFLSIPNCISFFLFTLSGSLFHKNFIDLGKKILRYLKF